ncbi:hypothetical protein [Streptomyces fagopyri]
MRAVLEARRKTAEVRVEALEAELEWVRAALVDAEEALSRRVIGLEQYLEALAEADAPAEGIGRVSQRKPVGPRRAVPHRQNASGADELSPDYQALMAAAIEAGGDGLGVRAAVVLGWDDSGKRWALTRGPGPAPGWQGGLHRLGPAREGCRPVTSAAAVVQADSVCRCRRLRGDAS